MMIEFVMPLDRAGEYSLNKIYAGVHWTKRQKQAEKMHWMVLSALKKAGIKKRIYKGPVTIQLSYNTRLDIDNHGYLSKLIIDGLKGYVIADDTKKHVDCIIQDFWNKKGVRIRIWGEEDRIRNDGTDTGTMA